jgi:hypothetical protein
MQNGVKSLVYSRRTTHIESAIRFTYYSKLDMACSPLKWLLSTCKYVLARPYVFHVFSSVSMCIQSEGCHSEYLLQYVT